MSLLMPDTGLLFWMVLIFAVVVFVLAKFGFPVITKMVDQRKEHISTSLKLAKEAEEKLSSMKQEQARMLEEVRAEQNRMMKEAAEARDTIIEQARIKAQDEAARIIAEAKVRIEAEKESAMRDIRSQVALISVKIAEKIIRQNLTTDQSHLELVDKMLDEVSDKYGKGDTLKN